MYLPSKGWAEAKALAPPMVRPSSKADARPRQSEDPERAARIGQDKLCRAFLVQPDVAGCNDFMGAAPPPTRRCRR